MGYPALIRVLLNQKPIGNFRQQKIPDKRSTSIIVLTESIHVQVNAAGNSGHQATDG